MNDPILLPQNLAKFGVEPQMPDDNIMIIWRTSYPVITNYLELCFKTGLFPFGGGVVRFNPGSLSIEVGEDVRAFTGEFWRMIKNKKELAGIVQGDLAGKITSGYRTDETDSAHNFGLAIDVAVGGRKEQSNIALEATELFTSIGLYPYDGILHLDLANNAWRKEYRGGWQYWVRLKEGDYHNQISLSEAIIFANSN